MIKNVNFNMIMIIEEKKKQNDTSVGNSKKWEDERKIDEQILFNQKRRVYV